MMLKVFVTLFFLLTLRPGGHPLRFKELCIRAGEMVMLQCPDGAPLIWISPDATREMDLTNISTVQQREMGVLVHDDRGIKLVIFSVSVNHQGNYSCSRRNLTVWLGLTIITAQSRGHEMETKYSIPCHTELSCELNCPDENTPDIPNIISRGITWHKEGDSSAVDGYFQTVEEKDNGVYICTRSYQYRDQIFNMTFTVILDVTPAESESTAVIASPRQNDVVYVDLGLPMVIDCKAVIYSDLDEVFWLDIPLKNPNLPVFVNTTRKIHGKQTHKTVSLIFKKVSEEHLKKNYTCKLQSASQTSSSVTISLQKVPYSYIPLALSAVGAVVVTTVIIVIYVKLKIDITLFLRDTIGCHRRTSDGKSYDAFVLCYKSSTDAGLNADDKKCLEDVLEERFGYSLCLYDRDVLPGEAIVETVLDHIEESRTVVLVPTSVDPGLGSSLLSAIHEALVERQTCLIFIRTETTEESMSGSISEALDLLSKAGNCVTWKGMSSTPSSSSFWKQLRFYLPASRKEPEIRPVTQTI